MGPTETSSTQVMDFASAQNQLSELFGSYRAEWLRDKVFELYTSPSYFPELTTVRPCMLEGGRGSGKTTALRAMSFDGQLRLAEGPVSSWPYYGIYYKVNTNRVSALRGPELSADQWDRLFAHYFNLLISERLCLFAQEFDARTDSSIQKSGCDWSEIGDAFGIPGLSTMRMVADAVRRSRVQFEGYINNVVDAPRPYITLQGAPIEAIVELLSTVTTLQNKQFFIIIDEYENFLDSQQRVVNTLIKHSNELYTYKIGVRELGWRQRTTMNEHEQLRSPADFVRIDITAKLDRVFPEFAGKVFSDRLSRVVGVGSRPNLTTMEDLFPALTEDAEAALQDVDRVTARLREQLELHFQADDLVPFDQAPPLMQYLIGFWAQGHNERLQTTYSDFLQNRSRWATRYSNYKHSLLFTLRRGRRGIQKYYTGHDAFAELASNNIRFYLQLAEQALLKHLEEGRTLADPVSPIAQTRAAQLVGRLNLGELEGLSTYGMYLSRLVLGLGRVFQVMAEHPEGHAPEVNQFHLNPEPSPSRLSRSKENRPEMSIGVDTLLTEAVMHLALVRIDATKRAMPSDIRDYDYMLHPIFAPLFSFSYRKKRKMTVAPAQLEALVQSPRRAIQELLDANNRQIDLADELPDQLVLFDGFYNARD